MNTIEVMTEEDKFFQKLPKVELHAHLNGSISMATIKKLVKLHRDKWPDEKTPEYCDTVIEGGEYGTNKDPFLIFPVIHALTDNMEAARTVTNDVINEFADDGVSYLELRTTPREVPGRMSKSEYCRTVLDEIIRVGNVRRDVTVKLLLAVDRKNFAVFDETVRLFRNLKSEAKYSDILVGIDISGDPRLSDLTDVLGKINHLRSEGIKFAIHLAEIPNHEETKAVLATKPDRIGHGTCIHPSLGGSEDLWHQLITVNCPVEVCLSSNVICQTVETYHQHQAGIYLKQGIPIVFCTDDKGVFSCSLSQELRTAARTFGLSREEMFQLSLSALTHAFAGQQEKEQLRARWKSWKTENDHLFQV